MGKLFKTIRNQRGSALVIAMAFAAFLIALIPQIQKYNELSNEPHRKVRDAKEGFSTMISYAVAVRQTYDIALKAEEAALAASSTLWNCPGTHTKVSVNATKSVCIPGLGVTFNYNNTTYTVPKDTILEQVTLNF